MNRTRVTVIDYGLCNIDSMIRALEECGASAHVTRDPRDVDRAERIVLPGVGSFRRAMENLRSHHLDKAIIARLGTGSIPFLGVCLGMQLMASRGFEHGETEGLGLLDAIVEPLRPAEGERVPHIGWNLVEASQSRLLDGMAAGTDFYFVHSFHLRPADKRWIIGLTPYAGGFCSVVGKPDGVVFGTQFHPEKSQKAGFKILRNFLAL